MADDPLESAEQAGAPRGDGPTTASPATTSAAAPQAKGDDLDTLLAEYEGRQANGAASKPTDNDDPLAGIPDAEPERPATQGLPTPTHSQEMLAMANYLLGMERDRQVEREHVDGLAALSAIRGNISEEIYPAEMIGAWVKKIAENDPRVQRAWENRRADPQTYQRTVDSLGRRFHKEHGSLPDPQATADRAAVTAAVRGASSKVPEAKPPSYAGMSDAEFSKAVKDQYGFTPGV